MAPSRTLRWPSSSSAYGAMASIIMRAWVTSIVTWLVKISNASSGKPGGLPEPVGEAGVDRGHGPLAGRPQSPEPDPEVRMPGERKVGRDVHLYLGQRPRLLPLRLTDTQSPQETTVQRRMRLIRVQVTVLVEEYLGEGELQPLVVAAVRDQGRQVQAGSP